MVRLAGKERDVDAPAGEPLLNLVDAVLLENVDLDLRVFLLKLRGLEQSRLRCMEAMGWKDLTFRGILSGLPKAQKERLLPLFTDLDRELKLLLDAKDSADRMITLRLAEFQQALLKHGQANQLFERKA